MLMPLAAVLGKRSVAKLWLRACIQAGHLWALTGFHFEPYRPLRERREGETHIAILTNAPAPYRAPVFDKITSAPNVNALVVFDGASDTSVADDEIAYPHEFIEPIFGYRSRSYRDDDFFAEHAATRFAFGYLRKLRSFRPDVIVSSEFGWRTLNAAAYALVARIPLLIWWEGTRFTERKVSRFRTVLRKSLSRVSAGLLGFGRVSVEYLKEVTDSSEKLFFIPQAVDNEKIALAAKHWRANREQLREELGVQGVVLLCLGRWIPLKGITPYLDALRRLKAVVPYGSFTAVFAGEGPEEIRLQAAAKELGGAIRILGKSRPEEVPRLLAASDVLVFPTLRDCWGMVVNEALAAGIPVLGSRYSGAAEELLGEGDVGTLMDPLDPRSLDAALLAVVRDRKGLDKSPARFQQALAGYSSQDAADAILLAAKHALRI
jgi:glycosyltransferase involved in cell wall biosynthesis